MSLTRREFLERLGCTLGLAFSPVAALGGEDTPIPKRDYRADSMVLRILARKVKEKGKLQRRVPTSPTSTSFVRPDYKGEHVKAYVVRHPFFGARNRIRDVIEIAYWDQSPREDGTGFRVASDGYVDMSDRLDIACLGLNMPVYPFTDFQEIGLNGYPHYQRPHEYERVIRFSSATPPMPELVDITSKLERVESHQALITLARKLLTDPYFRGR